MNKLNEILKRVQKPGRYIGEETNSCRKVLKEGKVSVALSYPDLYEIGMSYLGLRILYHLLNEIDDVVCERFFAPWEDMEKALLQEDLKLFGLESKRPVDSFDIVGFSLSYELTYTNVINMLSLSGISIFSDERKKGEPLVIAGGTCCFNPEPMSRFIDIFFIGDAEETLPEFLREYSRIKQEALSREDTLKALSKFDYLYIPSVFSGRGIKKASVKDLNKTYYPVKQIVPLVKTVHDRIAVEIMRGCPNMCRFCQAGAVNKPVRIRTPEKIKDICVETYRNTGYSQISILSLSSVNYPYILDLIKDLSEEFDSKGISISIPSLRIEESFYDLPQIIAMVKKTGLTFAPETAQMELQKAIGKNTEFDVFSRSAETAFSHGWNRLKLYFMVGFPSEISGEVESIVEWSREIAGLRKKYAKKPAEIKVSVNPFIPKPHTPLQWVGMRPEEELDAARVALRSASTRNIQIEFHDIKRSIVEAALARGSRKTADAIYIAWKNGAKMDGWSEFFDFSVWESAFKEAGLDINSEATRSFSLDEPLPWSHIQGHVDDDFLKKELLESGFYK